MPVGEPLDTASAHAKETAPGAAAVPACAVPTAPGEGAAPEPITVGEKLYVIVRMSLKFLETDKDNGNERRRFKAKAKAEAMEQPKEIRKDLRVGTEVEVLEIGKDNDKEHKDKLKIKAYVMHKGEKAELVEWAKRKNLARTSDGGPLDGIMPGDADEADLEPGDLPDEIVKGHETDHDVNRVDDWVGLLDDDGNAACLAVLKAKATMAMHLVAEEVRTSIGILTSDDLEVVHRRNKAGVARTEVWTKKMFEAGALVIAPWTTEIKDRLWTTGLSTHLDLPREAVPGHRMLALDGRGRSHLAHEDQKSHIKGEVGNLFWAITRTSDAKGAALRSNYAKVHLPQISVQVPGGPLTKKNMTVAEIPQIPVLCNPKRLEPNTKLTVLIDEKIESLRQQEQQTALEAKEAKRKADGDKRGPEAKKPRTN